MSKCSRLPLIFAIFFILNFTGNAWSACTNGMQSTRYHVATAMSNDRNEKKEQEPEEAQLNSLYRSVKDTKSGSGLSILLKILYDPSRLIQISPSNEDTDAIGKSGNKMPIVIFLSGADCPHESYMWLATRLVREGFCVTLSSCVVPFGDGTCLLSTPYDMTMLENVEDFKRGPSSAGISLIIKELRSLRDGEDETPLAGKLDLERLVLGGHSSGGRSVLDAVAFDSPLIPRLAAAFSYGASLVNSGGFFAAKGSVLPCEAKDPPPLLLLGGSRDGVSAKLSKHGNDATETLRRTMDEGVESGNGDADLLIIDGANHLDFCSPIDFTCRASKLDLSPCNIVGHGEKVRGLLGDVICSFLRSSGVLRESSGNGLGAFRPNVPPGMLHLARSFRVEGSSTPPMTFASRKSNEANASSIRSGNKGGKPNEKVWRRLSSCLDELISTIISEVNLTVSDYLPAHARSWEAGNLTGSLEGWESPSVLWAVRYANKDAAGGSWSAGFNVWLRPTPSMPSLAVPHLTAYVGVRGKKATLMVDYLPRVDLATHPDYVLRYYRREEAALQWALAKRQDGVKSFSSADATIRSVQSPNAMALSVEVENDECIQYLLDILSNHCKSWLSLFREANAEEEAGACTDDNEGFRKHLSKRDLALRRVLRNHEQAAGERFIDNSLAKSLADSMAGPELD